MIPEQISPEFVALQDVLKGRYSLVRELGRGGMGVVFLAREVALDRLVAIKLLPPSMATDPTVRERFLREARTAASLAHPNIVAIHSVENSADLVWFAMEYVPGETLGDRLRRDSVLPSQEALAIIQQTAYALAFAHARGVVHRDVKPDNILLAEDGDRVVVTDFGIAQAQNAGDSAAGHGTLHYMAPEQALGETIDARADVYALGVTAFETVAGRRPFEGYRGGALVAEQSHSDPPPVDGLVADLPPSFASAIDRAIARDPDNRFDDADQMAQALQAARALVPQLPVALRRFARHSVEHSERLGMLFGVSAAATAGALIVDAFFDSFLGFEVIPYAVVGSLGLVASLLLVVNHLNQIRQLSSRGYSRHSALRAIDSLEQEDRHEEAAIEGPGWSKRPQAVVSLGTALTLFGIYLSVNVESIFAFAPAMLLALVTPALVVRRVAKLRGKTGQWWTKLLRGEKGRRLWNLATLGLAPVREAPVGGEPTALAVGSAVQALFSGLPAGEQRMLAEVPDLAERLEARALDREAPDSTEAMAALETLRIDLMRMRAGQLKADGLTEDLVKLREVGHLVDAIDELP